MCYHVLSFKAKNLIYFESAANRADLNDKANATDNFLNGSPLLDSDYIGELRDYSNIHTFAKFIKENPACRSLKRVTLAQFKQALQ